MHEDEIEISDDLVRRLLDDQLPDRAGLSLTRLDTWGTDHVIYRLGDDLSVRLPKIGWAAEQGVRESRWLPLLAAQLPVEVPTPVYVGSPAYGYPFAWYVAPWIRGTNPRPDDELQMLVQDIASFVRALQEIDVDGGPPVADGQRGGPLKAADASTRERAAQLRGETDVEALLRVWDAGRDASVWAGPPRWVHGDLLEGNLVARDGRLAGVIDWGGLAVGDPAVELVIGWSLLDAAGRESFRAALGSVDDAMWLRGRAWAVSQAVHALPYYRETNPDIVRRSWRVVQQVLADVG